MDLLDSWFESIRNGNLKEIISIYKSNPDFINKFTTLNDGRNDYQTNAIIEASFHGNRDVVKWLIDNNADVNSTSDGGWRPIHFAAQQGHVTTVNLLVLGGAEVNAETDNKKTAILFALQAYMRDTVKKLLHHGASLVGIDRSYLQMCIQKDILDPAFLNEANKSYLTETNTFRKVNTNGYELMNIQHDLVVEEIKPIKLLKHNIVTEYDNELKRRKQELLKKMRRSNDTNNFLGLLVRKVAQSEHDNERISLVKEVLILINNQEAIVPQTKFSDQVVNILELCLCDSDCSEEFISTTSQLMMIILHNNIRRGDAAVVEFWCRIFDKMTNLQIEQYTLQILKMLIYMVDKASDGVVSNLKSSKDLFLQNWEYFFENLCFPKCLNLSLIILKKVYYYCPEAVIERFHNVIDIMIGWCIHPDTDSVTMASLCERSVDLHDCWVSDTSNLKKTLTNLQKDVLTHCQMLSRFHRLDKDRSQVDELKLKIKYFCFALSCVTAGISKISNITEFDFRIENSLNVSHELSNSFIIGIIEKLAEGLMVCSKQIDFDNLLLQSNTVILHLLSVLNKNEPFGSIYQCIYRYVFGTTLPLQSHIITEGSNNTNYHNRELLMSYMDIILICLTKVQIEPTTVVQVLSPVNWIHSCIFYGSSTDHRLMEKYLFLVDIISKSQCVTTFYQILLSDLELAINTLVKLSNCTNIVRLVQSNAFKTKTYDSSQAELAIKYNINLILFLHSKLKDSAVLIPPVPILFMKYLIFIESNMTDKYPSITVFLMDSISKLNLESELSMEYLKFLCPLLNSPSLDLNSKRKGFFNLKTVIFSDSSTQLLNNPDIVNLVLDNITTFVTLFENEMDTIVKDCLRIITKLFNDYESLISSQYESKLIEMIIKMCLHASYEIRCESFKLYFKLQKSDSSGYQDSFNQEVKTIQSITRSGRCFKFPIDFSKTIFSWLLNTDDVTGFNSENFIRLHHLMTVKKNNDPKMFRNRVAMVYNIIMNACWDCVKQKLKFDSNADSRATLITIENMVKWILTNGASSTDRRLHKTMGKFASKSPHDQALCVNLLLLLLDILEKMFYNAYEGCCIGFPPVSKSTETFFVTNKHVCIEWFIKMRLFILALAQYSGQWSTVVWHGFQLLKFHFDKHNEHSSSAARILVPEVEDCIVLTAMAFSKLGNWTGLVGLSSLAVTTYGSKFDWIDALADKTVGRLELALSKFESYIRNHHDPERMKQSSEMRLLTRKTTSYSSFILCMEEIADCYKLLINSDGLEFWKSKIQFWKSDSQMLEAQKSNINWDRLICLTKLSKWDENLDDKCNSLRHKEISWKYRTVIDHCEDALFLSVVDKTPDKGREIGKFIGNISSLQSISDFPSTFSNPDIILINERLKFLELGLKNKSLLVDAKSLSSYSSTLPLSVISFCNTIQNVYDIPKNFSNQKYMIKWDRKHMNFERCMNLITQCFSTFLNREINKQVSLSNSQAPIIQMQLEQELVKLLWEEDKKTDALQLLTNSLREGLLFETSDSGLLSSKCKLNTKSLLTLFTWLCNEKSTFTKICNDSKTSSNLQFLIELAEVPWINGLPLVSPQHRVMDKNCNSTVTNVCSQLLILASKSQNQEKSEKSFMTLAQWCLSRSHSLDELGFNSETVDMRSRLKNHGFTVDMVNNIELLLKTNFSPSQMKSENDWFDDCYEDPNFIQELRSSIMAIDPDISGEMADEVLKIWQEFIGQHFSLHVAAADAYFSFLKDSIPLKKENDLCIKSKTTANLRILSLLGKRSRYLRESIITKIKISPPGSWTNVIPQLFARLKHSDVMIRNCMTELLQRLAVSNYQYCKLIIYPTLVGALNESDNVNSPYHEIKKLLVDNNRVLVDDVSLFIKELRRITVLRDELWVSSLGQCYDELNKKAHQLQSEIEKIDSQENTKNKDVFLKLKYKSIIQAAVFILDRTFSATSTCPETPREIWFHNMFFEEISNTIEEVKNPKSIRDFNDAWKKVKDLQEIILTESNSKFKIKSRRGRHQFLSLKLDDVSPSLSKLNDKHIPLPGMNDKELLAIDTHISILPTKTKPKKFRFISTDGHRHSYLYKGLEDLRLDERVMQILGIANTMFSKINEKESIKYHITTYSVTPLGTRAGLIQMVEEATSLFSLYKRHQMHNKNTFELQKSKTRHSNNLEQNEQSIPSDDGHPIRPTDIYWKKLKQKLEAAKIDISFDNRDKWPLSILIEVLTELSKETSSDLLSKELWCCSINSSNWYKSSVNFTRSCAVMSMMGHLLGLGDRHLDNLLVNLSTGQMIHIDYNVCFDKGVSLKVPEKVPFRLTDIITNVFGPMGVEGMFKISCENVYEIIQQFQDSILTLMDTFVFDPIVDWSYGIESGHYGSYDAGKFSVNSTKSIIEKRSVEFNINMYNFQLALINIEDELRHCQEKLRVEFTNLHDILHRGWSLGKTIEQIHESNAKKLEMIQYLRGYESNDQCNLIEKFQYIRLLEERSINLDHDIKKRCQQMKMVTMDHGKFFNRILSTPDFISLRLDIKTANLFFHEHVVNIQMSLNSMIDLIDSDFGDCIKSRYESTFQELTSLTASVEEIKDCFMVLEKYRNIIQEMPQSYFSSDRCSYMLQICEELTKNSTLSNFDHHLQKYSQKMEQEDSKVDGDIFQIEKNNWSGLLKLQTRMITEWQNKLVVQSHDEEIKELEGIWQLTMYENVAGINMFKAVLLEQYIEMATITSQLDAAIINKIPDSISLGVDYNVILRKYLQLLNAHENYFKILTNSLTMFGIYLDTNEASMVGNMMLVLQKMCVSIITFENKFIDIIMPESIKIMKQLSYDDNKLLDQLKSILQEGSDSIILHFNIAFTSTSYDIKNYDNIHLKTVVPMKEKISALIDISNIPIHDSTKQLRILIASFYTTINHTYQLVCDFIDACMSSSTPSSWNFIDLVAASSINISPIWNKSIKLFKDTLYIYGIRCLVNTLDQCKIVADSINVEKDLTRVESLFNNMLQNLEIYFNFINKHILVGVGSQCFGKMLCLLLEHAGWNIDAMIAENMVNNCALNAEYICGSVVSFRKTEYPNAINFYTQLQYRFNKYKTLSGFNTEPNLNVRFLNRNISFHKSIQKLAKNQLLTFCWSRRLLLNEEDDVNDLDMIPLYDLVKTIDSVPERLSILKNIVLKLDSVNSNFQLLGEEIKSSGTGNEEYSKLMNQLTKFNTEKNQSINSLKKRFALVNDVLMNIDRFECLRTKSERGSVFDKEVLQFLSDSKDLREKLSVFGVMIKPIEEEIIKLKEESKINKEDWWNDLLTILDNGIRTSSASLENEEKTMRKIVVSFEKNAKDLKEGCLTEQYYALISHLKPTLRICHNITKKLKNYIALDETMSKHGDITALPTNQDIRLRTDRFLKLTNLFERFNGAVDELLKFLLKHEFDERAVSDFMIRLHVQLNNVIQIKDFIVPEMFSTLFSLSPLAAEDNNIVQSLSPMVSVYDIDVPCQYGFSNNNMAEINGPTGVGDGAIPESIKASPIMSGDDPFTETNFNQRSVELFEAVDRENVNLSAEKKTSDFIYRDFAVTGTNVEEKFENSARFNKKVNNFNNNNTNKLVNDAVKKLLINSNSAGVQKAIEVWKLMESRMTLANQKSAVLSATSTISSSSSGVELNELDTNKIAINQYVDKLIKTARSAENLARMYEGWTAWV